MTVVRAPRIALGALALLGALILSTGSAAAANGGFSIDGTVPDAGAHFFADPYGATSELGALNASYNKLGNINTHAPTSTNPTLGYTSITPGQDLSGVWLDTSVDPNTGHVWLYFAFQRVADSTGQVLFEFDQNAAPTACDYSGAILTDPPGADTATQALIDTCNPWANRSANDFALVFDTPADEMWEAAIRRLGADPALLQASRGVH